MDREKTIANLIDQTFSCCQGSDNCARTVLKVMMEYFEQPNEIWHKVAGAFGGGVCSARDYICGAVSGGLMVIGLMEEEDQIKESGQALLDFVKNKYGGINCKEILDIDFENDLQVSQEKAAKGISICTPLVTDICLWLAQKYDKS